MSIFQKVFPISDHQGLTPAEEDFDRLLERVEADEMDLDKLENRVREEFDGIGGETKNIIQEVDRAIGKTTPIVAK